MLFDKKLFPSYNSISGYMISRMLAKVKTFLSMWGFMHSYILWKCPVNVCHYNEEINQEQEDPVFKKQWIQHYKMILYYLTGNNIYIINFGNNYSFN